MPEDITIAGHRLICAPMEEALVLLAADGVLVDATVTDPPYGLRFMGKKWDYDVPSVSQWHACLRVMKPGAHLLAFAGTRTQHRMAVRIEDAGFDIRDMIAWLYGSGFPKSHNLEGEWEGWGTALKPAMEPITVARRPFEGTVAENVAAQGTGALNIDGCRVGGDGGCAGAGAGAGARVFGNGLNGSFAQPVPGLGRWPANILHDGSAEVVALFPSEAGAAAPASGPMLRTVNRSVARGKFNGLPNDDAPAFHADSGSAARFFYCAKASAADRDEGLDAFRALTPGDKTDREEGSDGISPYAGASAPGKNPHPTVKPVDLMRYLCRLVTPPGGTVLDPFMGSGSTGKAAIREGFRFIGIERDRESFDVAVARLRWELRPPDLFAGGAL